jgi:Peptidase family M1 domain
VKKILFLAACNLTLSLYGQNYWQQEVNYIIDVSLIESVSSLEGFLKLQYINHSPDTLSFIWFHLWPNAYKNDRTAFSDQLLENGTTDFYFSDKEKRGYINHLDFRVNGAPAQTQDHPEYFDIIKVLLPFPLPPGKAVQITTPFHEKLPYNFSRGGYSGKSFQITQWYPKPAVYDHQGWHPIPYLDQGEFYSEFGNFDVRITLPGNFLVAATGELQNEEEKQWLKIKASGKITGIRESQTKTLEYKQNNIHDFAWFADRNFVVNFDTLQLHSGKTIDVFSFYSPEKTEAWKNSIQYIKDAVLFRSSLIGEYPYSCVTAVEATLGRSGGMEYPTITLISSQISEKQLPLVIEHEVGHNWFYGILENNERRFPWMDEGINTYYDRRFEAGKPNREKSKRDWFRRKLPDDPLKLFLAIITKEKTDQPISTPSEQFTRINYSLIAYAKTSFWMKQLEDSLGVVLLDSCMREYFRLWMYKHTYPKDLQAVIEKTSGKNLEGQFALLDKTGPLTPERPKKIKPTFLFSLHNSDKINYLNLVPAIGYNLYDQFMVGALIHNFNLPASNFQFLLAPLYATGSNQFNWIGQAGYRSNPGGRIRKIEIAVGGSRFSTMKGIDSNGKKIFGGFLKFAPSIRLEFANKNPRGQMEKWLEFKSFLIGEKGFNYSLKSTDSVYYPTKQPYSTRYLNQLTFNIENFRVLYPYDAQFQIQQGSEFYRINLTGNYFLNYSTGGGLSVRIFAAKFGYIGERTPAKEAQTGVYQPKLTATRGYEDYTYSNYFIGRNEFTGLASQQIMMKDGGLKLRTDLFEGLQGRSDNWIAALNFNSTLPNKLLPSWIPLKLFLDIGTYANAWQSNPSTSRFLYVGGLQLSLLRNCINIYAPLLYSSDFSNNLKTVPEENTFWRKISFSIDIQRFNLRRITRNSYY